MARDFFINGESMCYVKGAGGSGIGNLTELGLAEGPIRVTLDFHHRPINLDAWGAEVPIDMQWMLAGANIAINFINFDRTILDICMIESMGGAPAIGQMQRAGPRLGGGNARFAQNNHFISLNIASPQASKPWRFYSTYMVGSPVDFPLGTEKSVVQTTWRAIPYAVDPWGAGLGARGVVLWDYQLDD